MVDVVSLKTRSQMMAGIKGRNTKPEIQIRKALHKLGFRYSLYNHTLPGKPDLIFPKHKSVIQVNGCFWHKHNCHLFKWPSTRPDFWKNKISGNRKRDSKNNAELNKLGWRVLTIWECALKGKSKINFDVLIRKIEKWLTTDARSCEIEGR